MNKKIFNRSYLDFISVTVLLAYAELKHFHVITPNEFPFTTLSSSMVPLFLIPLMSIMVRAIDFLNEKVRQSPIAVKISKNQLTGFINSSNVVSIQCEFSKEEIIVADPELFTLSMTELFKKLMEKRKVNLAPYVVVLGGKKLSKIETDSVSKSIFSAGASYVVMTEEDNMDIRSFVEKNPQPNFA